MWLRTRGLSGAPPVCDINGGGQLFYNDSDYPPSISTTLPPFFSGHNSRERETQHRTNNQNHGEGDRECGFNVCKLNRHDFLDSGWTDRVAGRWWWQANKKTGKWCGCNERTIKHQLQFENKS